MYYIWSNDTHLLYGPFATYSKAHLYAEMLEGYSYGCHILSGHQVTLSMMLHIWNVPKEYASCH